MKSKILVGLQFFIIFLMVLPIGSQEKHPSIGLGVIAIALLVGILAIAEHKRGNFNIRPDIKDSCELVMSGIYRFVRHPMYLSVLLAMFGVAIIYFTYYEFALFIFLVITLMVKLLYEEHLWKCHDKEYSEYMKKTKRLIPFLF